MKKERLAGFDFARSVCAIGIIAFHYACHSNSDHRLFYVTANSGWGDIIVTAFLAISGATLYYNYPNITSLRKYLFKRWKSIFPVFYIAFLFFFFQNAFRAHKLFYGPAPITIVLSILGLDGYLLYRIPNYYIIGEWFLGAIILLYMLYPIIVYFMNKSKFALPIVILIGYCAILKTDFFMIVPFRNLFTCLASFYCGILTMKYRELFYSHRASCIIAVFVFCILTFVQLRGIPINGIILEQIHGVSFLLMLVYIGEVIKKFSFSVVFKRISGISYPIFLLQHIIIIDVQGLNNPIDMVGYIGMLIITIGLVLIYSQALSAVGNAFLKSGFFKKLECKFC